MMRTITSINQFFGPGRQEIIQSWQQKANDTRGNSAGIDVVQAKEALNIIHRFMDIDRYVDQVILVNSPREAQQMMTLLQNNFEKYLPLFRQGGNAVLSELIHSAGDIKQAKLESPVRLFQGHFGAYYYYQKRMNQAAYQFEYRLEGECYLHALGQSVHHLGLCFHFNSIYVMVNRPLEVHFLESSLHNEEGPAIVYRDGSMKYCIYGQEVSAQFFGAPSQIPIELIQEEKNHEVKRWMVEKYGAADYLFEIGCTVVDVDMLNLEGSSLRSLVEDQDGQQWLIGSDGSTGRVYHMPVGEENRTCSEAHSFIGGFDERRIIAEC